MSDYKLADGSLSTNYQAGDEFNFIHSGKGLICRLREIGTGSASHCASVTYGWRHLTTAWCNLTPTPETKRKVADRKRNHIPDISNMVEPLARIVDWLESERGDIAVSKFEENETWVLNGDHDHEGALNTECGEWIAQEDYHLIRINTNALPKQRTLTIAEAEREFGVKIINDNSKN